MSGENPFVAGARVAIFSDSYYGRPPEYKEGFVDKVHKTGRFTLRGSPQQWRPSETTPPRAYMTSGNTSWSVSRPALIIWDDSTDNQIQAALATHRRRDRMVEIRRRLEGLKDDQVTDAMLDQIEAALPSSAKADSSP
ncbi:MAG TPA: hypothetical protein VH020_09330 [Stellaceae bacterium]|jgi:hypothetical protein|nr:hypothetical protein [Stellaceae bacterium]